MNANFYMAFPGMTAEEMMYLQHATDGMNEKQQQNFYNLYASKRKSTQDMLLLCILGFFGLAGMHRMAMGQVGLGLVYFFTCGLFWIGTFVDLLSIYKLTNEHNRKMAFESCQIIKMGFYNYATL